MSVKIAITGNYASGKSTFVKLFTDQSIPVFNSDAYVNELYGQYVIKKLLKEKLELNIEATKIDKNTIISKISENPETLYTLEEIFYPLVKKGLDSFFEIHDQHKIVVAEIPMLFEASWDNYFDRIILLKVSERDLKNRLEQRKSKISNILIKRQNLCKNKESKSHLIIDTSKRNLNFDEILAKLEIYL